MRFLLHLLAKGYGNFLHAARGDSRRIACRRPVAYGAAAASSIALSGLGWATPGTEDVADVWLPWMDAVARHGLINGCAEIDGDYPPGAAALLLAARRLLPAASDLAVVRTLLATAQLASALIFAAGSPVRRHSLPVPASRC